MGGVGSVLVGQFLRRRLERLLQVKKIVKKMGFGPSDWGQTRTRRV